MTHQPWWRTDEYVDDQAIPSALQQYAGLEGVALVRAWPNGKTDPGWGAETFMSRYQRRKFNPKPILMGYDEGMFAFAFVMRSVRLVCIDIDGKNGGLEHVGKLGMLPYTLAETSKSGDGYHLFYKTSDDQWDPELGFAEFADRIGIEQGVDIRATGCVYHHPHQRWNDRAVAELPQHIKDRLRAKAQAAAAQTAAIKAVLTNEDPLEVAMMQDELITDLNKPIAAGKRNTTLFAIGTQMCEAQVPGWQGLVEKRATDIGLDRDETAKLIANITKYGAKKP
jgi:hypothetical protein